MPMTQGDIQEYYATHWKDMHGRQRADGGADALRYSSRIQDAVMYPVYEQLIRALGLQVNGGSILDVGCGSGRWVRFFLDRFTPTRIIGVDFASSSIELLREGIDDAADTTIEFHVADIADPEMSLGEQFDVINVANVLYHIPEQDKYRAALSTLARHLKPDGCIVTTEYMPRVNMRTEWMLVRSRYEFEALCTEAGLEIVDIRAATFFSAEPVGMDGPDTGARQHFHRVRGAVDQLLGSANEQARAFLVDLFAEVDAACLAFSRERIADVDMPAQKLVTLRRM